MVALSIRQPWAWLIVHGHKDVENRSWSTAFRGRFLVHAGRAFDSQGYHWAQTRAHIQMPPPEAFPRGGLVGEAEIVDCVNHSSSVWFSGPFGFVLGNARPLPFTPLPGRLNFFPVPEDVIRAIGVQEEES